MSSSVRYHVNVPRVVHETIDGEVVIINLDTGSYYSLDGVGAAIWNRLEQSAAPSEIAGWLAEYYKKLASEMEPVVQALTDQLQAEELLVPLAPAVLPAAHANGASALPPVFVAPVLHKHNDMQDLLLLDPIHEVDETGWPTVKKDPA